jgi:sulfur-carrier protein adenylyltransferase/sulfurtransferase
MVPVVTPAELAKELLNEDRPFLVDVRENFERGISCLDDDLHMPLSQFPALLDQLDPAKSIVVYCRTGARSAQVVRFLMSEGFSRVRNLEGGINAWSSEVDPTTKTY